MTGAELVTNHIVIYSRLLMNVIQALFQYFSQLLSFIYYIVNKW